VKVLARIGVVIAAIVFALLGVGFIAGSVDVIDAATCKDLAADIAAGARPDSTDCYDGSAFLRDIQGGLGILTGAIAVFGLIPAFAFAFGKRPISAFGAVVAAALVGFAVWGLIVVIS